MSVLFNSDNGRFPLLRLFFMLFRPTLYVGDVVLWIEYVPDEGYYLRIRG